MNFLLMFLDLDFDLSQEAMQLIKTSRTSEASNKWNPQYKK